MASARPDPFSAKHPTRNRRFFLNELEWINSSDFIMWLPFSDAFHFLKKPIKSIS